MSAESSMFATLSGAAGLVALVPAVRIRPKGVYRGLECPYIVEFPVALERIETHAGPASLECWPYQISIFAHSWTDIIAVRAQVFAALGASADPRYMVTGVVTLQTA